MPEAKDLISFTLYPEKFIGSLDLQKMTSSEFGMYCRILFASSIQPRPCFIECDDKTLMTAARETTERWAQAKEIVLSEFKCDGKYIYNEQLLAIYKEDLKNRKKITKKQLGTIDGLINYSFDQFWNDYGKKVGSQERLIPKWLKLSDKERELIREHIPKYILFNPEKQWRMKPERYLNDKGWLDELIDRRKPSDKNKQKTDYE